MEELYDGVMRKASELWRQAHSVSALMVHLVFVAKWRRKVFDAAAIALLRDTFWGTCARHGSQLQQFNGEADHVHLLVQYQPSTSISQLAHILKGTSSRALRALRPDITRRMRSAVLWSPSYFASSCGGAPLEILKQYIDNQAAPH